MFQTKGLTTKFYAMVKFELNLGKLLKMKGEGLKGRELAVTFLFLVFIIIAIVVCAAIGLPKVLILS